jgi:heme/copper-type cytochrome/quinol oxidase subunit 2
MAATQKWWLSFDAFSRLVVIVVGVGVVAVFAVVFYVKSEGAIF